MLLDEVGDATGEHARLARAGARQHEQRALEMLHGLTLRFVQRVQVASQLQFARRHVSAPVDLLPYGQRHDELSTLTWSAQLDRAAVGLLDDSTSK